jgi:outer membrane biosynthesis protein TonB
MTAGIPAADPERRSSSRKRAAVNYVQLATSGFPQTPVEPKVKKPRVKKPAPEKKKAKEPKKEKAVAPKEGTAAVANGEKTKKTAKPKKEKTPKAAKPKKEKKPAAGEKKHFAALRVCVSA